MGDRIVRKLLDKVTGLPVTGKTDVVAKKTLDPTYIAAMPETPAGSGLYATAAEHDHGEYKIFVDGVDTTDTQPVEPLRFARDWPTDKAATAFTDRALSSKVYLSSYLSDGSEAVTHAMFASAIAQAASSARTLVMDKDVALTGGIVTATGGLILDMNGKTLTAGAYTINAGSGRNMVFNGSVTTSTTATAFIGATDHYGIKFTSAIKAAGTGSSFIACQGLAARDIITKPVVVGCSAGTADRLLLSDRGADDGTGRLDELQAFVDTHMPTVVQDAGDGGWVETNKTALNRWAGVGEADFNRIVAPIVSGADKSIIFNLNGTAPTVTSDIKTNGFNIGAIADVDPNSSWFSRVRMVALCALDQFGVLTFTISDSTLTTQQFGTSFAAFLADSHGASLASTNGTRLVVRALGYGSGNFATRKAMTCGQSATFGYTQYGVSGKVISVSGFSAYSALYDLAMVEIELLRTGGYQYYPSFNHAVD